MSGFIRFLGLMSFAYVFRFLFVRLRIGEIRCGWRNFEKLEKLLKVWARLSKVWFGLIRSGSQ